MHSPHIPVMVSQIIDSFKDIDDGVILDCTLGYGGHTEALLKANPNIKIIACDKDEMAITFSTNRLKNYGKRIKIYKSNFSEIIGKIDPLKISGVLADIGVSSLQLDLDERGFSTNSKILDMRMDKSQTFNAYELVNSYSQAQLEEIFYNYADIKNPRFIAKKIVDARKNSPINSSKQLANIVGFEKFNNRSVSIATLVFQAIRIEVNNEINELTNLLTGIEKSAINNAIISIISFHSIEDRIVKNKLKQWASSCICPSFAIKCECGNNHSIGKIITKKPLTPSQNEIKLNPRSSSSKLRIFKIER